MLGVGLNVRIDDTVQENSGLFVYAPVSDFFQLVGRFLLPNAKFISAADARHLLPEDAYQHLSAAWRLWDQILEKALARIGQTGLGPRFGISASNSARFARQRLIRASMEDFCAAHSVHYFTRKPVLLLKPAPYGFLREVADALGCSSPGVGGGWRVSVALRLCSVVHGSKSFGRFANGIRRALSTAFSLMRPARSEPAKSIHRYDVVFTGHKSAAIRDKEKLSEPDFWQEVSREVKSQSGRAISVLMLNGVDAETAVEGEGKFVRNAKDIFHVGQVRSFREGGKLLLRAAASSVVPILTLRIEGVADDLLAITALAVLKSFGSDLTLICTNSQMRGDFLIEAAKIGRFRTAMLFYSTNNSLIPGPENLAQIENPALLLMDHEVYFSWGVAMDDWLQSRLNITSNRILRSGPVMFASYGTGGHTPSTLRPSKVVRVGLFDVTPVTDVKAFELGLGRGAYRCHDSLKVFTDVINACSEVFGEEWELVVKFKRKLIRTMHDSRYETELSAILAGLGERVIRFPPEHNPWIVLGSCDVVIGFPFTSMVDASHDSGKPSCYFYPPSLRADLHIGKIPGFCDSGSLINWLRRNARVGNASGRQLDIGSIASAVGSLLNGQTKGLPRIAKG